MQRLCAQLIWIIPGIYLVSLLLPVFDEAGFGWQAFMISFLSIFDTHRSSGHIKIPFLVPLAWFANPALWVGYYFLLRSSFLRAMIAAMVALLLAMPILLQEGSWPQAGYWVWLLSMMVLAIAAGAQFAGKGRENHSK